MAQMGTTQGDQLEQRLREVLREIVVQYVATGEPVSSRALAKSGRFGLSPATLRNVMADLEDLGFLSHPHTSAGRVPTDIGYRYFIDYLMSTKKLPSHERQMIEDEVRQASNVEEMMQVASRVLYRLSDQVGLVFLPSLLQFRIRSMDFIPVAERRILGVMVGTNGMVINRIIETGRQYSRDELERIGNYITTEFSGINLFVIRDRLVAMMSQERARFDQMIRQVIELGMDAVEDVLPQDHDLYLEGAASILNKPEFSDAEAIRKALHAFEEKEKLVEILNLCIEHDEGQQILVGSESQFTSSYNFSLVTARYGTISSPVGIVGIIGPTRMEYGRVAPLVRYLSEVMSRKIQEASGEDS